ncbi:yagE family protein [Zymoseptoria brevis]|uniref:YagE family protein n=1 Tax=Zymoseptoria brevis TaxID=1047168 RepID=A0A0F4GCX2_9PEZI|nr:yagE family protein [Zymoseptoria brevis]
MNPQRAATWISFRSIVKRSLTTAPPAVTSPLLHRQNLRQNLTSTAIRFRKIPKNHFTSNRVARQENDNKQNDVTIEKSVSKKRKNNSKSPNSLRKVAVEAQRSHAGLIRGRGKTRHVDPDVDTKDVTAYCAAETYNLTAAKQELEGLGYRADPEATGLFPQVLHVQTTPNSLKDDTSGVGDVFIFPSGCVVTWHVPERTARDLVTKILPIAAAEAGHLERMEEEEMEFVEDTSKETSRIIGDTIILGTKRSEPHQQTSEADGPEDRTEIDTILAKIAFSSALARSTKLAVLENRLSAYFASTQSIPLTLASGKPVRHTRSEILQKTGELLLIRAQLNLYSELTDSLPDLFWDSPHELGLEGYYEMVGRALDVGVRIKSLNEKMDYAGEIAAVLRERLSEKQGWMLEWMIIGLICIEVGFGVVHLWREGEMAKEWDDERRVRKLAEAWLQRELSREKGEGGA